ncbi:MAG: PAS domain S-box protein [Ignavibacteriaceae bacterium]
MSVTETLSKKFNLDFSLLDEFYDMCIIISKDYEILNYNKSFYKIADVEGHGVKGENFLNLIDESYRKKVQSFFEECKKDNDSKNFITKFNILNRFYDIDLFVSPAEKDSFAKNHNLFVIARDITEERKKELELLRFYNIAEKTIFPLVITNLDGNMIYVNPAYLNGYRYIYI